MRVVVTEVTAKHGPVTGHFVIVVQQAEDKVFDEADKARKNMAQMQGGVAPEMNVSVTPEALPRVVRDALQLWLMSEQREESSR